MNTAINVQSLDLWYGTNKALKNINMEIPKKLLNKHWQLYFLKC